MVKRISTLFSAMLAASVMMPNVADAQTASSGGPYELPYSELWNDQTVLQTNEWTLGDNNGDGISWTFVDSPGSSILYNGTDQESTADDWLVSPYLALTAGKTYKIETGAYKSGANQKVSVAYGLGDDPTTYDECVPTVTVNGTMLGGNATKINGTFTPSASGNYRVAFHCTSNTRGYLILLPVRVYEAEAEDVRPAAVEDLNVEVGAKGAITSKVSFTVPTTSVKGDALSSLTRVQIYRDNTPDAIKTYENPTPGQAIEWQDETVKSGEHVYTVISTANDLRSDEASKTVYVGVDTPMAPQNLKIFDNLDGTLKFTWDAVTENSGAHGGYVDVSETYYSLYSLNYGYLQKVGDSEGLTTNEFTVSGISYDGSQGAVQYALYAYTNTPTDTLAQSEASRLEYIVGKPHAIPYYESFPNKSIQAGPWAIDANQSGRFGLADDAQDGDGGSLQFDPTQTATKAMLRGPKVDISNAANPQIVLWYYAYPGTDSKLSVIINRNGQTETTVGTVDYSTLTGDEGWRSASFDLKSLSTAGTENGYIRPYIVAEGTKASVQIDNIKIYDAVDNNIEATIDAPAHVQNGKVCGVNVKVSNLGLATANGYTVNFYVNGEKVDSQDGEELAPNAEQEYEFSYAPPLNSSYFTVQAEAEWAADQMDENNVTEEKVVELTCSNLPKITDLSASLVDANTANVTWSAMQPDGAEVKENFDNFTPWAISAVGDWTLYDGDKAGTYAFGGIEYPHQGEAGSYIVFNPWQVTGLSGNDLERFVAIFRPHSGRQAMMSVGATIDTGTPTNDWLITPELSGDEQTITFWTCAPNDEVTAGSSTPNAGPETFDVYYSEDDTNVNSFIKINKDSYEATCNWTKFDIDVPEGAKYFAIVHTSTGSSSSYGFEPNRLLVDDVTYQAGGLRVMGYNVYRDGLIAKRLDNKTTSWIDENVEENGGIHYYNVMVVYANGESDASNTAGVGDWTGVNNVNNDNLILGGAVYNISGQKVANDIKDVKGGLFIHNGKKVLVK